MKRIIIIAALFITAATMSKTNAQVKFNLNVNIGSQPVWGPVGYDHAEYYYLPDIEAYYYVPRHQFVYLSGNKWIFSATLPPRYRNYDLYSGYKVVVNEPYAYRHFDRDRRQYSEYRGRHDQQIIRDSHDRKYRNYSKNKRGYGHDRRH